MKYKFGEKIRQVRERKKFTMKEVALSVGISESMVSQIERNKVSPAIDTLLSIADFLEIDIDYLFKDFKKTKAVNIVRKNQRRKSEFDNVTYEHLSKTTGSDGINGIEAYHLTIDPGSYSGSDEYGHIGKELGVIVEGEGEFSIGNEKYSLSKGDSISFESDIPHRLTNTGNTVLRAFWVITPPRPSAK